MTTFSLVLLRLLSIIAPLALLGWLLQVFPNRRLVVAALAAGAIFGAVIYRDLNKRGWETLAG